MAAALAATALAPAGLAAGLSPTPVNDAPTVNEDETLVFNVLANDTDPEGDPLHISSAAPINASYGTGSWNSDGTLTFTPKANWSGTVPSMWYFANDGASSTKAWVTITVQPVDDPPTAEDQTVGTDEDTPVGITLIGSDPEGAELSFAISTSPAHGELTGAGVNRTYTPDPDFNGTDTFEFTVSDASSTSAPATVTVEVAAVPDSPVAHDMAVDVEYNSPVDIVLDGHDGDGDELTYEIVNPPAHGVLDGTAPNVTYTPDTGHLGADSFTYKVIAGGEESPLGTVSIMVADGIAPTVLAPTIAFGTGRVNEQAPLTISWSATDSATGIKNYDLQARIGGGSWVKIYTGLDSSITAKYPFGTDLQWRVRATDNADNVSDWVESPVRRLVAYQGGSPVVFKGTWTKVKSSGSSGTNYRHTTTAGKKVKLSFTGLGVLYVAPKLTSGGYAKVSIDGSVVRVRLKASATALGRIMESKLWGSSGSHTIKVVNDQGGKRTTFDAFVVLK